MSGPSYPAMPGPVAVISPQFCMGYPVELTIVRKMMTLSEGNFGVTDVNGNLMFKVKGKAFSLRDRHVLLDAAGNIIITFQQKLLSAHRRWMVFRGNSTNAKDQLFSIRFSSLFQMKTKLDVFLASNTAEKACDFKIKGKWFGSSCTIYARDSKNIVAKMHKNHSAQSILLGKESFGVTVYPNIDYAFIVALIVLYSSYRYSRGN